MIIGIEITLENPLGMLPRLFKGVDLSRCSWTSRHYEGYTYGYGEDIRFEESSISGKAMQKRFFSEPEYFVDFVELKGYSPEGQITEVETYSDFVQSDCRLIILINDFYFVEVYAKDLSILETIYENSMQSGSCKEVMYKTEENDCRIGMSVK